MTDDIELDPALEPPAQDDELPEDVKTDTPAAKDEPEDEPGPDIGGEG